jgi:hypothetical protein
VLPELGPHLGALCAPARGEPGWVPLDDVRLDLATRVLAMASDARAFGDDRAAVVGALRRRQWLDLWDRAHAVTTDRVVAAIDARLAHAAATARFPRARAARLPVTAEERAAIHARLGAGAAPFVAALDRAERRAAAAGTTGTAGHEGWRAWWEAVTDAGRRLEAAWTEVERAVAAEGRRWEPEVAQVAAWRRPGWPPWLASALLLAATTWLGLVLGGQLTAPGWIRPFAEWWWRSVTFL